MSRELEKIKKFMTFKRDTVEETIKDVNSTKFALFLIVISIVLGVMQTLLQNLITPDIIEWIISYFGGATPSVLRIILDAIMNNIIFPILVIILTFYIGNAIKGEADSLNHVVRALGYSLPPLIIGTGISFLALIPHIAVFILVGLVIAACAIWFAIILIYALMITFKKGALNLKLSLV